MNRATFAITNTFAIMDLFNSRRNAKNHRAEPAPEMAAADTSATGNTATDSAV
jgi:hypothetical protein